MVPLALLLLGAARLAILFLPFRWYVGWLGAPTELEENALPLDDAQDAISRSIGRAVRATAGVTPWKSVCLPQAIAASILLKLRRIPHVTHFGLAPGEAAPDSAPMKAHAWIIAGERIVTGAPVLPEYRIVASFASPAST